MSELALVHLQTNDSVLCSVDGSCIEDLPIYLALHSIKTIELLVPVSTNA